MKIRSSPCRGSSSGGGGAAGHRADQQLQQRSRRHTWAQLAAPHTTQGACLPAEAVGLAGSRQSSLSGSSSDQIRPPCTCPPRTLSPRVMRRSSDRNTTSKVALRRRLGGRRGSGSWGRWRVGWPHRAPPSPPDSLTSVLCGQDGGAWEEERVGGRSRCWLTTQRWPWASLPPTLNNSATLPHPHSKAMQSSAGP